MTVNIDLPFNEAMQAVLARHCVTGELPNNQPRQEWLREIAGLLDAGQVRVFISKVFPLAAVAEAHRESQTWHGQGKLVLAIRPDDEPAASGALPQ